MTNRKPLLLNKMNGMQYVRPDMVSESKWLIQRGMRWFDGKLQQVERKKVTTRVQAGHRAEFVHLGAIPTSLPGRMIMFGLTKEGAYSIKPQANNSLVLDVPTRMTERGEFYEFEHTDKYSRWDTTTYNNHAWFVNEQNTVHYTDGIDIFKVGGECPAGKYVEVFYDHLVVGAPIINGVELPSRVSFSDLYNFGVFTAKTTNEAGSRDLTDYDSDSSITTGLTGMKRLGNKLIAYTDSTIYSIDYVGLPHVMNVNPLREGVGNSFHNAVVATKDVHYFISAKNRQFYALSAEGIQPIGMDIAEYFFPAIEVTASRSPSIFGFHDPKYKEIWWVYSTGSFSNNDKWPAYTKAVVYNYETKAWYVAGVEDIHSFCQVNGFVERYSDQTNQPFNTLYRHSCQELGSTTNTKPFRVWGSIYTRLLEETTVAADALRVDNVELQTGDFNYGTLSTFKEIDGMFLSFSNAVNVWISAREHQESAVTWTLLGNQNSGAVRESFTFPKQTGRVFRFRFIPSENAAFSEVELVGTSQSEEVFSVFGDGFDAPVTAMVTRSDGKIYVAGEFTKYKGVTAPGICRLNLDGTLDATFNPGSGFTCDAEYGPPTQLVVSSTGGVWCGYSTTRLIELVPTRVAYALKFAGVVRTALIRLGSGGAFEYDMAELTPGSNLVRLGGFAVDGTKVYLAYTKKGPDTDNFQWNSIARVDGGVLFRRRTMVMTGNVTSALRFPDVAIQDKQIIWSCPRQLVGGAAVDVLREDGVSILEASDYGIQRDLCFFVADLDLILQDTWEAAAMQSQTNMFSNPIAVGGRMLPGGFNNVYATYWSDKVGFLNGKFGWASKTFQHRGLYQLYLGDLDHRTEPEEGTVVHVTYAHVYGLTTFGAIWTTNIMEVGDGVKKVRISVTGTPAVFTISYNGSPLFGGEQMTGNEGGHGSWVRDITLSGGDTALTVEGYFNINNTGNGSVTTVDVAWSVGEVQGELIGVTHPNAWDLSGTTEANSGFEVDAATVDSDNTSPFLQALCVVGDTQGEDVFVVGGLKKFKGEEVQPSAMWSVTNKGVFNKTFKIKADNDKLSADHVLRPGKVFAAIKFGNKLLLGGRFTAIDNIQTSHIAIIDPKTGRMETQRITKPAVLAETYKIGGGGASLIFYQYEQFVFTFAAEQ